ncbi:DUF3974 domain-containing protein [Bacillus pacificus]
MHSVHCFLISFTVVILVVYFGRKLYFSWTESRT